MSGDKILTKKNKILQNEIKDCRICGSTSLESILLLPNMPLADQFITKQDLGKEFLKNIDIGICNTCGSVQNLNDTDMDDYYNDYSHTAQSSPFAMNFMRKLAKQTKENYFSNDDKISVLEIGSSSGEQLMEFKKLGADVLGIEPSAKLSHYANSIGVETINGFFDEHTPLKKNYFDVVVLNNTLDHIPRPLAVLSNIYEILKDNGIVVTEVHDLELIKQRREFCLFLHEHYTYLNQETFTNLLAESGFEVLSFELLDSSEKRGNSLLSVAQKQINKVDKPFYSVKNQVNSIKSLSNNIFNSIKNLNDWLEENQDKKIVAYGAGGRGVMTLAATNNTDKISFMVDKDPKAQNIWTPKSHIPVFGIEQLKNEKIDIIVVFSFGYFDEIVNECVQYGYKREQFISILDILNLDN